MGKIKMRIKNREDLARIREQIAERLENKGCKSIADRLVRLQCMFDLALDWAYDCAKKRQTKGSSTATHLMREAQNNINELETELAKMAGEDGTIENTGATIFEERNYHSSPEA